MYLVGRRLFQALPTLFLITVLSFALVQLAPGDFLSQLRLDPTIEPAFIEAEAQRLGLDQPVVLQYFVWLRNLLTGDLGQSYTYRVPVATLLASRAGATLLLAFSSLILTWLIAIPLGVLSAIQTRSWLARGLQALSYLGQATPSFILAIAMLLIAQNVPGLPVGGMTSIDFAELNIAQKILDLGRHLLLPTLVLSITSFAGLQRLTRGTFLDVMRQDYIQTARAKGLSERRVIWTHAFRNAINPLITILGFEFAGLLSGSFIAEYFFNWPGLGRLLLDAVQTYDINVVMAGLLLGAVMLIVGNLIADILLQWVDPRIRF